MNDTHDACKNRITRWLDPEGIREHTSHGVMNNVNWCMAEKDRLEESGVRACIRFNNRNEVAVFRA